MEHVGELLVLDSKAILLVDKGPFCCLFKFVQLNLKDSDIPHRDEAHNWIMEKMDVVISCLSKDFAVHVSISI
jgi:hypothetical protein